ncbi:MAG: sigma-70 family RNA polymerase sigma factor [Polyangiaceae bacterium]|nr:sigma-70 family RNA polymerase sigma factor [Polyangiaceae bacterium]
MIESTARHAWTDLDEKLRPFVARRVRSVDVEDVIQNIYLRMQRGLADLRDDERFGPWVYQLARSAVADHHRAALRHPSTDAEPPEQEAPAIDAEEEGAAERDVANYVSTLVAMLPSPYREALTLTELEGLTQKEAATMLGISLSGMKSRVQRGREKLRESLDACCNIALDARGRVLTCEPRPDGPMPGCRCR